MSLFLSNLGTAFLHLLDFFGSLSMYLSIFYCYIIGTRKKTEAVNKDSYVRDKAALAFIISSVRSSDAAFCG